MDVAVAHRRPCSMKSNWAFVRVSEAGQGGVSPVDLLLVSGQPGEGHSVGVNRGRELPGVPG